MTRHARLSIALTCALGMAPGCGRGTAPTPPPAVPAPSKVVAKPTPPAPAQPERAFPEIAIRPTKATLLPGDPGLQMIGEVSDHSGGRFDLTSNFAWSAEPPGVVEVDAAGYVRPIGPGRTLVEGHVHHWREGETVLGRRRGRHRRRQRRSTVGFRPGHRADPDPSGLQHRRLPRAGGWSERLPPLALRLRSRGGPSGLDPRPRRAPPLVDPARVEPVPGQSDGNDPARRRPSDQGGVGGVQHVARLAEGGRAVFDPEESRQAGQAVRRAGGRPAPAARVAATPGRRPLRGRPRARRHPAGDLQGQRRLGHRR